MPFELLPAAQQFVTGHNFAELPFVNDAGFDELKDAGFIFSAAGLQGDGCEVFGSKNLG